MWQTNNVVMLPTNEKAIIFGQTFLYEDKLYSSLETSDDGTSNPQYLYITDDSEIKEGDYYIQDGEIKIKTSPILREGAKKIIATTDKSLTIPGYNSFDEEDIVNCYLPKPSPQFIEKYIEEYNKGNVITDINVEYEEATYEKWMNNGASPVFDTLKVNLKDNTINIKPIKDSWNREEVINIINNLFKDTTTAYHTWLHGKWIEKNL